MVKKISSSLAASTSNATLSKALDGILALEAEVSHLWHHVTVLSKRLHKLDPPRGILSGVESNLSPIIEEDFRQSVGCGEAEKTEEMTEESPQVASWLGGSDVAVVVAEDVAMATFEAGASAVAVEFHGKRRRFGDEEKLVEEDVVVGGKIVPLGVLEPERVGVVEVESWTVVPQAAGAIQVMREREVVQEALVSPRGRDGTEVHMRPSRGRGLHGCGTRSGGGSVRGWGAFRGANEEFYACGRGRGGGG